LNIYLFKLPQLFATRENIINIPQHFGSPLCGLWSVYFDDLYFSRWIQKSCFLVNVIVDGKQLGQLKKINVQQRLPILYCGTAFWRMAGGEWGENEKDWIETSEKKMADVSGGAGMLLVFFCPVKRDLVDY